MKKKGLIFLVIASFLASFVIGCGGGAATPIQPSKPADGKTQLSFSTGGTSGTYYALGAAMAQTWNSKLPNYNVTVQPSGASTENLNRLDKGEADLGLSMNTTSDEAFKGGSKSFPQPLKKFKAIGVIYPEVVQVVTLKNSGITSIDQLKGKKVNPGPPGSGTYGMAVEILKAYGIELKDIQVNPGSFSDAIDAMKDGHLDAAFAVLAMPASAILDIATSKDVRILEIKGEQFAKLKQQMPLISEYKIPANTYKGQTEDAMTITLKAVLYAKEGLSEDVVYTLTKTIYENAADVAKGHAMGKEIKLEKATEGVTTPFHPGAVKYFKEKGINVPSN